MSTPIPLSPSMTSICKTIYTFAKAQGLPRLTVSFSPPKADPWPGDVQFNFIAADAAAVPPVVESAFATSSVSISVNLA